MVTFFFFYFIAMKLKSVIQLYFFFNQFEYVMFVLGLPPPFLQKTDKYSSYPVYHTIYETFELVENFYDPTFKKQLSVAQLRGALVYELADSQIIPFNIQDYAKALKNYATSIYNLSKKHDQQLKDHRVSFGKK